MGVTTRLFLLDPEQGWQRIPMNQGVFVHHGAEPLPKYACLTLVVAFAHVEVDRWRVLRLLRLERARWRFDQTGIIDQVFLKEEERRRFWPSTKSEMTESHEFCASDIQQIEHLIGIRVLLPAATTVATTKA